MIVHEGHRDRVWSVAFAPDGKSVVSGSWDKTIQRWDAHSSSSIGEPLKGHELHINSVACSPLGKLIASGSYDNTIRLWDSNTGQQSGEAIKGDYAIFSVAFSLDGKLIASGPGSSSPTANTVQLWDVESREAASKPFEGHTRRIWSLSFSSGSTWLASGSADKKIRVWDVEKGITIGGPLEEHTSDVRSVVISPNGDKILSCSDDATIRIWDVRVKRTIGKPYKGHVGKVYSVALSPCGPYVASGGEDKTVRLWDIRTGRQVDQSLEEHTDAVYSVAFSPCGQYIASGSRDRKVIIRRTPQLSGDADPVGYAWPQSNISESTQQMFECFQAAGLVDFSFEVESRQETLKSIPRGYYPDIWQARLGNDEVVSIKGWQPAPWKQWDYTTVKRVASELFDLSKMDHSNVCRLRGVVMSTCRLLEKYICIVSDNMDYPNLLEYLIEHPDADRYQLCAQVASGLSYMHRHGKVHGDLKGVNVVVLPDGVPKLSHLGSSAMSGLDGLLLITNNTLGTVRWEAPEILNGEVTQKTTATDIYALGMTMLEIFTGKMPYSDCQPEDKVIELVKQGLIPRVPDELQISFPTDLESYLEDKIDKKKDRMWWLIKRCLRSDPSKRCSSNDMAEALQELL